jgi:HemY protein
MKLTIGFLVLLFVGAVGAHFLIEDSGHVLVTFHGWALETSVPVLVLLLVALYFVIQLVLRILRVPGNVRRAATAMRERRARESFRQGMLALNAGDWARAERLLGRSAHDSEHPVLHYLGAARAAEQIGAAERRDRWLALAAENQPEEGEAAVVLTQAEAHLADGRDAEALALLDRLEALSPNHPHVLALQAQAAQRAGDWERVRALMPRLRRAQALAPDALDALETEATMRVLAAAAANGATGVRNVWRGVSRNVGARAEVTAAYADALVAAGDADGAEEVLRASLESEWNADLVHRYGALATSDPAKHLQRAERWLEARPEDPDLLLELGRLCVRNELWGKARSYFESSLAIRPSVEGYRLYGELFERLGERERAAEAFRKGLALASGAPDEAPQVPALPQLTMPVS